MSACPACGEPLYGWLRVDAGPGDEGGRLLERCESCRLGAAAGLGPSEVAAALLACGRQLADGRLELRVVNRDSVQASLGGAHWAALVPGRLLYPSRESLPAIAAVACLRVEKQRTPPLLESQTRMWQTIVNAFTFNENFADRVRGGGLRPSGARARIKFAIDTIVTLVVGLPAALFSIPLELIAAAIGRGGELVAVAAWIEGSDELEDQRGEVAGATATAPASRFASRSGAPAP